MYELSKTFIDNRGDCLIDKNWFFESKEDCYKQICYEIQRYLENYIPLFSKKRLGEIQRFIDNDKLEEAHKFYETLSTNNDYTFIITEVKVQVPKEPIKRLKK